MFQLLAAGAGLGAGIAGSAISANANKQAAQMQADAAMKANEVQKEMYDRTRADQQPWMSNGLTAFNGMQNADFQRDFTANDFTKDPGYDFRMQQGQQALERSAAARGGLQSGATLKALTRYGQDFASNEYNNAYNRFNADRDRRFGRLSEMAGFGQRASGIAANAGQHYADAASANYIGAADARAAAKMKTGDMWGKTLSSLGGSGMGAAGLMQGR